MKSFELAHRVMTHFPPPQVLICVTDSCRGPERTSTVRKTVLSHHGAPREWKSSSVLLIKLVIGEKTLLRKSITCLFYRSCSRTESPGHPPRHRPTTAKSDETVSGRKTA